MELKELRIANYYHWCAEGKNYPLLIEAKDFSNDNYKNFEPIPLTEEWLLKFGFNCRSNENEYTFSDGCEFTLGNHKHEENVWWFLYQLRMDGSRNFRYVHDLQNLFFALTGEELTIKS